MCERGGGSRVRQVVGGDPAVTTRGMGPDEMKVIADCIADCVFDFANKKDEVASKVEELTKKFPLYE